MKRPFANPYEHSLLRKKEFNEAFQALCAKYTVYHWKNTCGMVGLSEVVPNSGYLTGEVQKVNCPWCVNRLWLQTRRKKKKK